MTAVLLGLALWWVVVLRGFGTLVLATGQQGGTYTAIGEGFADFVAETDARFRVETKASRGTPENLVLLERQEVDFAIAQSGYSSSERVRVVAKLYSEVLHVLVRRDEDARFLVDLSGKRLALGERESGTREVTLPILAHFGVTGFEDVAQPAQESLQQLRAGEVDAVFVVTALQSEVIRESVRDGELRFMSLGFAAPGLVARFPFLTEAAIPAMTYQCPSSLVGAMPLEPISTVGVPSLLVCREDESSELVFEVTKSLFASRNQLSKSAPEAYQISEVSSSDILPWALHEGAQRYYRRQEPGFLERYAEVMAFLMSLAAAAWAVLGAASRWSSRKKKNLIDDYYTEVASAFMRLDEKDLSRKSLAEERGRLRNLRIRAFQDLAKEKLRADESFGIFQNQLALCLADVRRREAQL